MLIQRKPFLDAVGAAAAVVDPKIEPKILQHIYLTCRPGEVMVWATNTRRMVSTTIACQTLTPETMALDPRSLERLLKAQHQEDLRIERESNFFAAIYAGRSVYKIAGVDGSQAPLYQQPADSAQWQTVPGNVLTALIGQVEHAMYHDEGGSKANLAAVLLESVPMGLDGETTLAVAINGHQMAVAYAPSDLKLGRIMIPRSGVYDLAKFIPLDAEVAVCRDADWIYFRIANRTLAIRLFDASTFLEYQQLLTTYTTSITLERGGLMRAVKCLLAVGRETDGIRFDLEGTEIQMRLNGERSSGHEVLPIIKKEGDDPDRLLTFGIGLGHLQEALTTLAGDRVRFEFEPNRPQDRPRFYGLSVVLRPEDDSTFRMIMTCRVE